MHLPATGHVFTMDKHHEPVVTVESGTRLTVETLDCFSNTITSEDQLVTDIDFGRINPATGPIAVTGAEPGDVLAVEIHGIELAETGTMVVAPGFGLLGEDVAAPVTRRLPVSEQAVDFGPLRIPLAPMIGVIGTAPAGEPVVTGTPHHHGGNMDCGIIGPGATVYLPVEVPGALLALGDVHAAMGDGEIGVSGVEIPAVVDFTVRVVKDCDLPTPLVRTPTLVATVQSAPEWKDAAQAASRAMVDYLRGRLPLTHPELIMLLSAAGNLRLSQVVNPNATVRMEVPQQLLDEVAGRSAGKTPDGV